MANQSILHPTQNLNTLETGNIENYTLKPASEAQKWLSAGFLPFGSPVWNFEQSATYQAFIKPERIPLQGKLRSKAQLCFYLFHQGYKPRDIARMLSLTSKTVQNYIYIIKRERGQ